MEDEVAGLPQGDGEVVVVGRVVEEVLLDLLALVSGADHEVGDPVGGEELHEVPENRFAADLDHRLGTELGLLAHAGSETTCQQYGLHGYGHASRSSTFGREAAVPMVETRV